MKPVGERTKISFAAFDKSPIYAELQTFEVKAKHPKTGADIVFCRSIALEVDANGNESDYKPASRTGVKGAHVAVVKHDSMTFDVITHTKVR